MKKFSIVTLAILFVSAHTFSQNISFPFSFFSDFNYTPMSIHDGETGQIDELGNPEIKAIPFQHRQINIGTIGIVLRNNLKDFNTNSAIAYDIGFNLGIGMFQQIYSEDSVSGDFSLQIPLMLKWYSGHTATHLSDKKMGFSLGIGMELNKIGLFWSGTDYPYNDPFIIPCASIGVIYKKDKGGFDRTREFNIKIGLGGVSRTSVDGQGNPFEGKSFENGRATTVKFSLVFMPFE